MHRCQGCETTSSFRDILGDGDWGVSVGSGGGHSVCCLAGSSQLPARPIKEGGKMPQGERGMGWDQGLHTALRVPQGPPSGVRKTDLAWNRAAVSQACHQEAFCLVCMCW